MLDRGIKSPANTFAFVFLHLFALCSVTCSLAWSAARPQDDQRAPFGSLHAVGEAYVNGVPAPPESSIFPGDLLRIGPSGSATFRLDGKGSLEIRPNTEIIFTGAPQYAAELKFGKVVMNSADGATGMNLRAGNSVVLAVAEGEQSSSSIEAPSDGSFVVTCVAGSVGVIPLQSGKGVFIRAGQSVGISAQGELSTMSAPVPPPDPPAVLSNSSATPSTLSGSEETAPAARKKHTRTRWILVGAGIAGAGVAAAILSAKASASPATVPSISLSSSPILSAAPVLPIPPPQPAPSPQPPPSQPAPSPQPAPPQPPPSPSGNGCHKGDHHDDSGCKPHVVLALAFHF